MCGFISAKKRLGRSSAIPARTLTGVILLLCASAARVVSKILKKLWNDLIHKHCFVHCQPINQLVGKCLIGRAPSEAGFINLKPCPGRAECF